MVHQLTEKQTLESIPLEDGHTQMEKPAYPPVANFAAVSDTYPSGWYKVRIFYIS